MQQCCRRCFAMLKDGQRVSAVLTGVYHEIKSQTVYALDKEDLNIDPDSLVHADPKECTYDTE